MSRYPPCLARIARFSRGFPVLSTDRFHTVHPPYSIHKAQGSERTLLLHAGLSSSPSIWALTHSSSMMLESVRCGCPNPCQALWKIGTKGSAGAVAGASVAMVPPSKPQH